ncbi:HlyD family efflux transporter periplasmic adaptor subunit [Massilia sp. CCM 8734]|uniref:efflux RND transporter periplasmic adaptor subunit n=1 Tax=Massilia sp. CCM 8734 TaxID=2609283 RepID=UPI00141DD8D8|nr:HlyD family efflux transporter periplasmic adaptor subunit [Massilia sp. CCM 8734]NHZ94743.1 HlyD family efflux transporter periplasmic adaptor subunit [Massilia sp. CCM 8734]
MQTTPNRHDDQARSEQQQALHSLMQHSAQEAPAGHPSRRALAWAAALAVAVIATAGYWQRAGAPVAPAIPAPPRPAPPAASDPADASLKMSGFFSAHEMVQISATVLARVKTIRVSEGSTVKKGELLVELSNMRGDNDVRSAEQRLAAERLASQKAALDVRQARDEQQRQASLAARGFGTRKAMDEADLRVEQAVLELSRSRSNIGDALANLDGFRETQREYAIRAPFSGVVVAQNARVGEVVSPTNGGSYIRSGLLSLLNPATLEVHVSVQERLLPQLQRTGCALVSSLAQPDQIHALPFRLDRVGSTADRQRGAVNAILVPLHPIRVLPILETSADVQFVGAGDSRCATPPLLTHQNP